MRRVPIPDPVPPQGVSQLETLETVTLLALPPDHVQDAVHELGPLGVVTLGPVVAGPGLAEHEVVRSEDLAHGTGPHAVHSAGLQVHQHGPGHVLAPIGLVVVDIDPLQLLLQIPLIATVRTDPVLCTDHQNFCPIWFPHWPAWRWTISLMLDRD